MNNTDRETNGVTRGLSAVEALRMAKQAGGFARPTGGDRVAYYVSSDGWLSSYTMVNGEQEHFVGGFSPNDILEPWEHHLTSDTL